MTATQLTGGVLLGPTDLPPFRTVLDAVLDVASRTPDRIAVQDRNGSLSYADLVAESDRCQRLLREHGVVAGDRVATVLSRSVRWPGAVLAIWSVGAVYVPVSDPVGDRAREMLAVADARVLLADGPVTAASDLPPVLRLDRAPVTEPGQQAAPAPAAELGDGDHPAYVLFTSGSTGRPKGVQVGHRALASFCWAFGRTTGVTGETVVLGYSDATFDVSMLDLFVPLAHGARVSIMGREDRLDPALVQHWCRSERVTWGFLPVALLSLVDPDGLPDWRTVIAGAEAPTPRLVARWTRQPDRVFFNCYGPTEATVTCCAYRVPAGTDGAGPDGVVPFGEPLPNHRALVLGPNGPVGPGAVGELWVAGAGLADGYLVAGHDAREAGGRSGHGRVHDGDGAFTTFDGERYYRTGDQVRVAEDGLLRFVGRLDRQVKIRGQRVELAEVDARIERHPRVAQVVCRVLESVAGRRLVAFYRGTATPQELSSWAVDHLPGVLRPGRWEPVDTFPLTASGKIDESALTAREQRTPAEGAPMGEAPAEGETARLVLQVWEEFLGTPRPGRGCYASGGDSVVAMRLAAALRRRHGVHVPVASVLTARDAADLVRSVDTDSGTGSPTRPDRAPATGTDGSDDAHLTPAGSRLVLGWQVAPDSSANTIQVVRRIRGPLVPDRLRRALVELPARHPVLGGRIDPAASRWVAATVPPIVRVAHGRPIDGAALDVLLAAELAVPFDLATGPLWRALLVPSADGHVLVLTFHHLVFDGWSLAPVLAGIAAGYAGRPPEPERCWLDYSRARHALQEARGAQDRAWWRDHLAGAPTMLPLVLPPDGARTGTGQRVRLGVPADLLAAGRALARSVGCSPAAVQLAALAETLGLLTGLRDILVGVPIAERETPDLLGAVGMFTEIVPTRHRPAPDLTFRELCAHSQRELTEATAHRSGLQAIAREVGAVRDPDRAAVVQVLFNAYNFDSEAALGLPGTVDLPIDPAVPGTDFDLTLYHLTVGGEPAVEALTDAAVGPERVRSLLTGLVGRWAALVAAPDAALADVPVPPALAHLAADTDGARTAPADTRHTGPAEAGPRHTGPTTGAAPAASKAVGRPGPRVPPRPGVEQDIARVWAEVLDIPLPGATDNFFDVGGHSMAIAQVHERLAGRGLPVTLIDLFAHPTVRALAEHCHQESGEVSGEPTVVRAAATRGQARRAAAARRRRPDTGSSRRDTP